jgi:hypothetical protein
MSTLYYSLNDFNSIIFDNGYKLSTDVLEIIRNLNLSLGISNDRVTVDRNHIISTVNDRPRNRSKKQNSVFSTDGRSEEAWESLRSFKATVVEKKTDGIEKTINDIRICLNKISQKNYESILGLILDLISETYNKNTYTDESIDLTSEHMKKVANYVFEIASTNKFFSEIYASLYKELTARYDIFQNILSDFVSTFTNRIKDIQYVDQNTDYDAFCANNKINDARKATGVFIVNLVKKDVLPKDILLNLINSVIDIVLEYIETPDKVNQVEEITENVFLLVSESCLFMKDMDEWNTILEKIKTISQMKAKEKVSLSSRAIFKYMDIMDKIKKI